MAAARMRKSFAYPDSDADSEPEGLDEEEQEKLIYHLAEQDAKKNQEYKKAFMVLPLLSIILYLPSLSIATLFTHILAITSLLSTAYALYILPVRAGKPRYRSVRTGMGIDTETSPVKKYLDHLNAGVCVLLALQGLVAKSRGQTDEMWLAILPSFVFLLMFAAKTQLKPLDMAELEKLRYGYKGA